jgi:beta-glucanase (GH16 family)
VNINMWLRCLINTVKGQAMDNATTMHRVAGALQREIPISLQVCQVHVSSNKLITRADYHVYSIEWNEQQINWFVDDTVLVFILL